MASKKIALRRFAFKLFTGNFKATKVKVIILESDQELHKLKLHQESSKPYIWAGELDIDTENLAKKLVYKYEIKDDEVKLFKCETKVKEVKQTIKTHRDVFRSSEHSKEALLQKELIDAYKYYLKEILSDVSESNIQQVLAELRQADMFGKNYTSKTTSHNVSELLADMFRRYNDTHALYILGILWTDLEATVSTGEQIPVPYQAIGPLSELIDKYSHSENIPLGFKVKETLSRLKESVTCFDKKKARKEVPVCEADEESTSTQPEENIERKIMSVTFNAVVRYQAAIKRIELETKKTNKRRSIKQSPKAESKTRFEDYKDLHFDDAKWMFATAEACLIQNECYVAQWKVDEDISGSQKTIKMEVHVKNSSRSDVICNDEDAIQVIQGSIILLDIHLQNNTEIGDADVMKLLEDINSKVDNQLIRKYVNKWLDCRLEKSTQEQKIFISYVLRKLKCLTSRTPLSKQKSITLLEALRCQKTLPHKLQLSWDFIAGLLKGAKSSVLEAYYYLSRLVWSKQLLTSKSQFEKVDVNKTDWNDADEITHVFRQLCSNKESSRPNEPGLFKIFQEIVSKISTVDDMLKCIPVIHLFQQDHILHKKELKCLSMHAFKLFSRSDKSGLIRLVEIFLQSTKYPIFKYLKKDENMKIFAKMCQIASNAKSCEMQHVIVNFLHSNWLTWIFPQLEKDQQRDLLSKMISFITDITESKSYELEMDDFVNRYRIAIAPSLLHEQVYEEVVQDYKDKLFSYRFPINFIDRLKMCFYLDKFNFKGHELIYVAEHIVRLSSNSEIKISCLKEIFLQVIKRPSCSTEREIVQDIELKRRVAELLLEELGDHYDPHRDAEQYLNSMITIRTGWEFLSRDLMLENARKRLLAILCTVYQQQKEKQCTFAQVDLMKRYTDDFKTFIGMFEGLEGINAAWCDVIDNIIKEADRHRKNVMQLRRLMERLIVELNKRTAIAIDVTILHQKIEYLEKQTANDSACLLYNADDHQFLGSFQSILEIPRIFKFINSRFFINICLECKDISTAHSLDEFSERVKEKCIPRYEEEWKEIARRGLQMTVAEVAIALCGITEPDTLSRELQIVLETIAQDIPEEVKVALKSFICRKRCQELQDVFKIFKIQDLNGIPEVLKSPEIMEINSICLGDLHQTMKWIDRRFDEEKDWPLLSELSQSGDVVEFLAVIIHTEEDLRNLGDIIEEDDRSSLHIGLVADIIDVKRFIQSLLDVKGPDMIGQLIKCITEVRNDPRRSALSGKINTCRSNLSSIKELYYKLADRQETMRIIIKNTVENGTFDFTLQGDQSSYISEMCYETNAGIKRHLSLDDLQDSKSRALLAINSEMNDVLSSDDVKSYKKFISIITDATHVTDLLNDLYDSGHFQYVYSMCKPGFPRTRGTISCKSQDLTSLMKILENKYRIWINVLAEVRLECYYLNFFDDNKLWMLEQLLTQPNRPKMSQFETILKQLDLNYTQASAVDTIYTEPEDVLEGDDVLDWTNESNVLIYETALRERLLKLGLSLETSVKTDIGEAFSSVKIEEEYSGTIHRKNSSHRVQPGKVSLLAIKEGENHPMLVLLQLYRDTTGHFPRLWQALFCQEDTLMEEAELFLRRCRVASTKEPDILFTIVMPELSPRDVLSYIINETISMYKASERFMLAFIISDSQIEAFDERFRSYVTRWTHSVTGKDQMAKYLRKKWDKFKIVTSKIPRLGKTEYVKSRALKNGLELVNVSVCGSIDREGLIKQFSQLTITKNTMLHIDVGIVSNPQIFNTFILELTVFGIVKGRQHVFSLDTDYICAEIANQSYITHGETLSTHVQTSSDISFSSIFKGKHLEWTNFDDYVVSTEINSSVQVVCHYFNAWKQKKLDSEDIRFIGDECKKPLVRSVCRELLNERFIRKTQGPNAQISFATVEIYLNVFAEELRRLSASNFLSTSTVDITVGVQDVRSQFVQALDKMAMAFAPQQAETEVTKIMKWEDSNPSLLVFNSQDIETVTPFYRKVKDVDPSVRELFKSQLNKELPDYEKMQDLKRVLEKVCRTSRHKLTEPKFDYAVTPDNLLKMILIYKRIMAGIPVVIMGETGCGKTLLLTYLAYICEVPFYTMDIHAGTKQNDIKDFIQKRIDEAVDLLTSGQEDKSSMVWVFFDEINTCDHLGLFAEIMLRNSCGGTKLPANLVFLAACNPYTVREGPLQTSGGLSGKCHHDEKSNLVYRVEQLPMQMLPYVWDFGALQETDELRYIREMIKTIHAEINDKQLLEAFSNTISKLQTFTRNVEGTQYCVSLRDIRRCIELASFFISQWFDKKELADVMEHLPHAERDIFTSESKLNNEYKLRSVILALAHCYYCRIVNKSDVDDDVNDNTKENDRDQKNDARSEFLTIVSECFVDKYPQVTSSYVNAVIIGEQMDLLNKMDIPKGIAKNSALRENVFIIIICVLAHIPVFVVGNPGSSKSLSMQLIRSNLRGLDSKTEFFKQLPAVFVLSYQGSDSSTSEGIIEIFHKAQKSWADVPQDETPNFRILPVVLLDEVGLAESSPHNPLKVLHSLLEPKHDTKKAPCKTSVVGISNWALDPAKMNRAVYLSRVEPAAKDLYETAKIIRDAIDEACDQIITDSWLKKVTDSYIKYTKSLCQIYKIYQMSGSKRSDQEGLKNPIRRHFHGLRDFYALIKYISSAAMKAYTQAISEKDINISAILERGLRRNFAGFRSGQSNDGMYTSMASCCTELKLIDQEKMQSSVTTLEMIAENVGDEMARHLMIITDVTNEDLLRSLLDRQLKGREYKIIFGSHFQNDYTEDYFYRVLSNIILYMEKGVTIVLKGLSSIYGSLYDMLNQNYTTVGGKNSCRIALGPIRSPLCEVHKDFRCVVLVNEHEVDCTDPPFLNRFEKQFLTVSDVMSPEQIEAVEKIQEWTECFGMKKENEKNPDFDETDVFLGFHSNIIASDVYNMSSKDMTCEEKVERCKSKLLYLMCPEGFLRASKSTLSMESPEEFESIKDKYLQLPHHNGLVHFLKTAHSSDTELSMTIIYTHASSYDDIKNMVNAEISARVERLSNFKSEQELREMIREFWLDENGERDTLILQCSPHVDGPRMSVARYVIHECKQEAMKNVGKQIMAKRVCIIVHVDRRETDFSDSWQFSSLQGWDLVTVDNLFPPSHCFKSIVGKSVLQLIVDDIVDFQDIAKEEWSWALSCIRYIHKQNVETISDARTKIFSKTDVLTLMKTNLIKNKDSPNLLALQEPEERYGWLSLVASDLNLLSVHGTFDATMKETIRVKIRQILAKFVFFIENNSAWIDVPFASKKRTSIQDEFWKFWTFCIGSSDVLDICSPSIPERMEPASCVIWNKPFELQFPFFMVFHKRIEKQLKQNQDIMRSDPDSDIDVIDKLPTLEDTIRRAVHECEFHNFLDHHVDTYLNDLFTVFINNLHESLPKEKMQLLHMFLTDFFKPMTSKLEKAISKVAIVYFQMLTDVDDLLSILQLISTYIEFSNNSENLTQWRVESMDEIVEQVCQLTLPTAKVLESVGGSSVWQKKAASVILCAGRVAENTTCVFHFLSLCRNFCSLIQHFKENDLKLAYLADQGKNLQDTIATPAIFNCVHDEIEYFMKRADNVMSVQMIEDFAGMFYIRAFDANPDDCFLTDALSKLYTKDRNLTVLANPLLFRIIEKDIEDSMEPDDTFLTTGRGIIEIEDCIDKKKFPNLFKLDKFLRQQDEIDNPVAVVCSDLIQTIVFETLDEEEQVIFNIAEKSASVIAKSHECTMQLIFSVAFTSALFKTLRNVSKGDICMNLGHIFRKASALEEEEELGMERINALKVYLLKHLRQTYSMHDVMEICMELQVRQTSSRSPTTNIKYYSPMSYVNHYQEVKDKFQNFKDNQKTENEFDMIITRAKSQRKMTLALSAVIIEQFVLGRSHDQLTNTEKKFQARIVKKVKANLPKEKERSRFIEHVLNETIFLEFSKFAEKLGSNSCKVLQQISVIAHTLAIILMLGNNGPFYQCLYPKMSMSLPAGGTPVPKLTANGMEIPGSWEVICPSCKVRVVGSQSTPSEDKDEPGEEKGCPACKESLAVPVVCQSTSRSISDELTPGYYKRSPEELARPDLSIRTLQPIAYRAISIITHSIFLVGQYINPEENELKKVRENEELSKLFDLHAEGSDYRDTSNNIKTFLFEQIDQDWNTLQTLLQRNTENTTNFLHSVIREASEMLKTESYTSSSFEKQFSKLIVDIYRSRYLQNFKTMSFKCMGINSTDLEFEIDELCEESSLQLPRFFRYTREVTYTHFKMDVLNNIHFSNDLEEKHMFLRLVISMEDQLACLCHIKPIIDWYRIVFNRLSHRIKRQDVKKSIREFIESGALGSSSSEYFTRFMDSWNAVQQSWKTITGNEPAFGQMSDDQELADCLDQSEDHPGNLKTIINVLVEIQNQFLLKAYHIATSGKCQALKMQMNDDQIAALETIPLPRSEREIIVFKWHDRYFINSYIDTENGENINYNYASIERQLCAELVLNKKLLTTKHTFFRFVFHDELFAEFPNFLQEINLTVKQEQIDERVQEEIFKCYPQGDEKSKKVMEQIEIVLSFLQRSGGESTQPLHIYIRNHLFNSATNELFSEPLKSLQLCHIVHLYEIFEDIMATLRSLNLSNKVCEKLDLDKSLTRSLKLKAILETLDMKEIESLFSIARRFAFRYLQTSVAGLDKMTSPLADVMLKKMTSVTPELTVLIRKIPTEVEMQHARDALTIIDMSLKTLRNSTRSTQVQQQSSVDRKRKTQKNKSGKKFFY